MTAITPTEFEIRAAVEFEVGKLHMRDFELWAFRRSPIVYDENFPFIFGLHRSTKFTLPSNNIEAIATIIHLWKHRSDWKKGGAY